LIRFKTGLQEMIHPPGRFTETNHPFMCPEGCRYLHMQLTPRTWKQLEDVGDIPKARHVHTKGDEWWMKRCMKDSNVQDEYHLKTHWKIILIGTPGSGMFNHTDTLETSSWHGHIQGTKWWYLCGGRGTGHQGKCYETVLHPGEILYYGRNWWHNTRNVDTPTMTVTGTVVHGGNFEFIADKLHSECVKSALAFDFSADLCDALDDCYQLWHKVLKGKEAPPSRWKPWRELATPSEEAKRNAQLSTGNNYDGRNYIAE